ncbi:MAG: 30S ribosomal protein S13 [Thermoprotei archaeon]|nr:MAG: 30S ribosomal protein S13 [Thermoprotei archaeon]RLF18739.1 MAG: 30S ribosomal protein S13 [Thermoprotei archaeon]
MSESIPFVQKPEFKYVVRIADTDIDGNLNVAQALTKIRGIGWTTSLSICKMLGIDTKKRIGELSNAELKRIEDTIRELSKKCPPWLLNRRKDPRTGENLHLIGSDLVLAVRSDVDLLKKIRCWRGIRHMLGLKVRGQKTRTTGRTGITVGVRKKPKK